MLDDPYSNDLISGGGGPSNAGYGMGGLGSTTFGERDRNNYGAAAGVPPISVNRHSS